MPDKFQTVTFPPLSAGMVTLLNSASLQDNACINLLNMEYELEDMPQTRKGMTCWSEESAANHKFDKRISSLTYFKNALTPTQGVLIATSGTKIYRSDTSIDDRSYTDITGSLSITDDVDWQWRPFFDRGTYTGPPTSYNAFILIGLPDQGTAVGGTYTSNIVVWTGSGNMAENPNTNLFTDTIEEMNRRVFWVSRTERNRLFWSRVGAPFFTSGSGEVTASGSSFVYLNDDIVGLGKTKERLFIFHRDSIQQLKFGEPETDQNLFQIEPLTFAGGAVNKYAIVSVLNDVWFLSDLGWVSVLAVEKFGNFEQALIGDKILDLKNVPRRGAAGDIKSTRAVDYYEKNQCWISIPDSQEAEAIRRYNKKTFVMNYHPDIFGISNTDKRFSQFDGRAPFTAATVATYKGRRRLFLAAPVPMPTPTITAAALATGGTNPNGAYFFKVVAVDGYGEETLPSAEVTATVIDATNDRITITWPAHDHATNIRIYKGATSNGQDRYKETTGSASSFNWDTDTGATLKALPVINLARIHNIFLSDDKTTLSDDITKFGGTAVSETLVSLIETKDYVFGNEGIRKIGDYWTCLLRLLGTTFTGVYSYIFDYNPDNQKSGTIELTSPTDPLWDSAIYDSSAFASGLTPFKKFAKKFVGHPGRMFHAIRFKFKCLTGERWGFRGLSMDVAGIDEKESSDAA